MDQKPRPARVMYSLNMIPAKAATRLGQIRRDLAEIQILRHDMLCAKDQISRDNAIIRHSRTVDKIIETLQQLEADGLLNDFPVAK